MLTPPCVSHFQATRLFGEDKLILNSTISVRNGNLGSVGMTFVEIVSTIGLYYYLRYRNRVKDRESDTPEAQEKRLTSLDVIGDAHPGIFTHECFEEFSCCFLP
jgi:hypothetical protein